jgi:glycosyltransferase involved in cell wall biosynthesis
MLTTTEGQKEGTGLLEREPAEREERQVPERTPAGRGVYADFDGLLHQVTPELPLLLTEAPPDPDKPAVAVFCYEDPAGPVGQGAARLAGALAGRGNTVHVFVPSAFPAEVAGARVHVLGESPAEELLDRVQVFTRRASNTFLKVFPADHKHVTLLGYEWSSVPALSLLRGIRNANMFLSLHSLERQRSDMTSELSRQIADHELSGLREAQAVLFNQPAAAECARHWLPECAPRSVQMRQPFPVAQFKTGLDAGAVKARYQVGPVDPTVLYVGDMDDRYGPDVLLKAMPAILKNNKQVRLIMAGEGSVYWPLRVYARYLLLEHAVRLPGSVEGQALRELIAAADVVAVPSREATPWWPIQAAWAAGKPVVATHSAAPGLLEHEKDAVLCYPSENSVVWGVERVLFDPTLAAKLAQAGAAKLEERFGWNNVAAQVEELMGVAPTR